MARKVFIDSVWGTFTLNETKVGKNGNNQRRADVQLIQFYLRQFYKAHPNLFAKLPSTSSGGGKIKIDGLCGNQTKTGIQEFQKYYQKYQFATISVDGLVDVAHSTESAITGTRYTIHYLNLWFKNNGERRELGYTGRLEQHPEIIAFAPELRLELSAAEIEGEL